MISDAQLTSNCIITSGTACLTPYSPCITYSTALDEISVKRVKNGFVLRNYYDEYVFNNVKDLNNWLVEYYKKQGMK